MAEKPWITENWWVSEVNFWDEVKAMSDLQDPVIIHDVTLRDGEQTAGVSFRKEEKLEIAKALDAIGVDRIEAGFPVVSEEDTQAIKMITKAGLKAQIFALSRAMPEDVDRALDCGVSGVIIEAPAGAPRLQQMNWGMEDVLVRSVKTINYAKEKGLSVVFFPVDGTRADKSFLIQLLQEISKQARPDAVAAVDTLGTITPLAMYNFVKVIRNAIDVPVEVHTHNDLGMATGNTIAGIHAGAKAVHCAVNGLGEKCGNASLDEVAVCLKALCNIDVRIDLKKIPEISKLVENLSRMPLNINKPLSGPFAFARETGLGIELAFNNPSFAWPINPAVVGQDVKLILGKMSGKGSVEIKLKQLGINKEISDEQNKEILQKIKQLALDNKRSVNDDEFLGILKEVGIK